MIVQTEGVGEIRQTEVGHLTIKDADIKIYYSGKFYVAYLLDGLLPAIVEDIKKEAEKKNDSFVIIRGGEGTGKSNLAWNAIELHSPGFDLREVYRYNFEEFKTGVSVDVKTGKDKCKPYWLDEAVNIANKRKWNSAQNIDFTEWTMMMRSRLWALFMLIPDSEELDYYIRDNRCKYILTCAPDSFPNTGYKERGYFHAKKRTNEGWKDIGYGEYSAMPPTIAEEYERLKEESQLRRIAESMEEKGGSKYKAKYEEERKKTRSVILALHNSGTDREAIKQLFGINTDSSYYQILKRAREDQGLI